MNRSRKEVLFVSHNASRSGAPLILLGLIKEFQKHSDLPFKILLMQGGELENEFRALGKTFLWYERPAYIIQGYKGLKQFYHKAYYFFKGKYLLRRLRHSRVAILNTITNGHLQRKIRARKVRCITYVHEMESTVKAGTSKESLTAVLTGTDFYFSGSLAVKSFLSNQLDVPAEKIKVLYSSLLSTYRDKKSFAEFRKNLISAKGLPETAVIVGIAGTAEWRKGIDLLFPLITTFFHLFPQSQVYFMWKGVSGNEKSQFTINYDFHKIAFPERIILLPHGDDNIETISCFDLHLLLSREDPYPLVVLEAASFGIPTICFNEAGGSPEFVQQDAGISVPYGNLIMMAESIYELEMNSARRNAMGKVAQERLRQKHDAASAARELIGAINTQLYL